MVVIAATHLKLVLLIRRPVSARPSICSARTIRADFLEIWVHSHSAIRLRARRWTRSTRRSQQTPTSSSAITTLSLVGISCARRVDGIESQILNLQLFATVPDFITFGPINSGFFTVTTAGGLTPEANEIHLRNNYNALFFQDDWKFHPKLTLNFGMRWDYDSEFETKRNLSPRVGFAWAATSKTVVRGHYGDFYDQFRLGLVRAVPAFGGADRRVVQPFSYPRGFFGNPKSRARGNQFIALSWWTLRLPKSN